MSETPTTSRFELLERSLREQASREHRPVLRATGPLVPVPATKGNPFTLEDYSWTLVTAGPSGLVMGDLTAMVAGQADNRRPFGLDELEARWLPRTGNLDSSGPEAAHTDRLDSPGGVLVVPDEITLAALVRACGEKGRLSRALSLTGHLPTSSRLLVLTRALAARYALPDDLDPGDLGSWGDAFGLTTPRALASIPYYLERCFDTRTRACFPLQVAPADPMLSSIAQVETMMLSSIGSTSLAAECARFSMVTQVTATYEYMTACDVLARERARLSGAVFALQASPEKGAGWYRATGSVATRPGKDIVMLEDFRAMPAKAWTARVVAISVQPDGAYLLRLRDVGAQISSRTRTQPADFTEKPFLSSGRVVSQGRWLRANPEGPSPLDIPKRDVPHWLVTAAGA